MARDKLNILDALDKIDEASAREEYELWGNTGAGAGPDTDLFQSPKFQQIVHILLADPILVAPSLNWLLQKQSDIARAKLEALYTPEQLEEMYKNAIKEQTKNE